MGKKDEYRSLSPVTGLRQYLTTSNTPNTLLPTDIAILLNQKLVYLYNIEGDNIGQQNWKLSAGNTLTKDNMLYLDGNVTLESLSPLSRLQQVSPNRQP